MSPWPQQAWRGARALLAAVLVLLGVLGLVREYRAAQLTKRFGRALERGTGAAELQETAAMVARRFQEVAAQGPGAPLPPWLWRTGADYLEHGGSCGDASVALGAVLDQHGVSFRIVQINVLDWGASHVMVEAQGPDGRWLLLGPLTGYAFNHPATGQAMTLAELRALPEDQRGWLPRPYREEWSLYGRYRRTNWDGMPALEAVLVAVLGRDAVDEFSLRAWMLEPGGGMALGAVLGLLVLGARRSRRNLPHP